MFTPKAFSFLFCALSLCFFFPLSASAFVEGQVHEVFITLDKAESLIAEGATILDAREPGDFRRARHPQAANLPWSLLVDREGSGRLTDNERRLTATLRGVGVSNDRPVIIYGNWGASHSWGEEGRLYWTLDYLGHSSVYILAGGIDALREAGHTQRSGFGLGQLPSQAEPLAERPGNFQIRRREDRRISTAALRRTYAEENLVLIDTREAVEFGGEVKYGEARGGHIPGAVHLWWADLFSNGEALSAASLQRKLRAKGISPGQKIVAYCTGGIRSGFVYAVLRSQGYTHIANYDASMWEWTEDPEAPLQ